MRPWLKNRGDGQALTETAGAAGDHQAFTPAAGLDASVTRTTTTITINAEKVGSGRESALNVGSLKLDPVLFGILSR